MKKKSVLLIYTGGTIGMVKDHATGRLKAVDFNNLLDEIPALRKFNCRIDALFFKNPIDSSDADPKIWVRLVELIEEHYHKYDGFVVLHGTDTMAYSASALSFLIENLKKPIVFTGSQLPLEVIRTDGKENLITSIEIASSDEAPKEVCIYFEYHLLRANRTSKFSSEHFDAFISPNYPPLATAGVHIEYHKSSYLKMNKKETRFNKSLSDKIALLRIYPGIREDNVACILGNRQNEAFIIQTYGSGNVPSYNWLKELLQKSVEDGKLILNISQCIAGGVEQGKYESSVLLNEAGVTSGNDLSIEAAVTKLMFLLGNNLSHNKIKSQLNKSLAGEMDV